MALNTIVSHQFSDDKTNREFMDNEESMRESRVGSINDNIEETEKDMRTEADVRKSNPNKLVIQNIIDKYNETNITIYNTSCRQKLIRTSFYLLVCIPFIAYFVGILVGSLSYNSKIVRHITLASEI